MSPSKPGGKRPHRGKRTLLSDEDDALWQHTASTLDPVKRAKPRVHAALEDLEEAPARPRLHAEPRILPPAFPPSTQTTPGSPEPSRPSSRLVPPLADIDRKAARRIRSGRIDIEARLDLHGMRQSEAHMALRAFLHSCHAQGKRWVLVITGKGGQGQPRQQDHPGWPWDGDGPRERGILRRNVPLWLAEPDLRAIVVSVTEASIRHGGEGALYVQVRSRNRAPD